DAAAFVAPPSDERVDIERDPAAPAVAASNDVPVIPQIQISELSTADPASRTAETDATQANSASLPLIASAIPPGGGLEGRGLRQSIALSRGATPQSEAAVERGLNWLVAHQFKNGS